MVQKMTGPNARSANSLANAVGESHSTLLRWLREADTLGGMDDNKHKKKWTAEEKVRVVMEASRLTEEELGAFLRREGVREGQLRQWEESIEEALSAPGKKKRKKSSEAKKIQELERELRRKDKALAEASALLVLKKKAQAIWGDEDDDTSGKTDSS